MSDYYITCIMSYSIIHYYDIHIYRSNVLVPPLAVCRLLLVLQYMLFQFSEPCPKLAEQV